MTCHRGTQVAGKGKLILVEEEMPISQDKGQIFEYNH